MTDTPRPAAPTCNCIATVNTALAERNSRLQVMIDFATGALKPFLPTEKINPKLRGTPPVVAASYCPWCGVAYPPRNGDAA